MLPHHADRSDHAVEHDATLTDYVHVGIRVVPALAIAATPFIAFGLKTSCTSRQPRVDCSSIDHVVLWHIVAQVLGLVAAWTIARRAVRRWPVWAIAGLSALSAAVAFAYAVSVT